jgi:alkanesulfonate monooxygenase SsuD/methylene tetrahydromethanopterin reductase-like flavin-dependent oxidoreductase (luciferase family)
MSTIDVGLGLWNMRSTASVPASLPGRYAELLDDARRAESLGFHSVWLAEHHFWYDGWCPSPLTAAGAVLASTSTLTVGSGIHLLALWELETAASVIETLLRLAPGRLELGVGLGYRDEEFDGFGLARSSRGRRMDAHLDGLSSRWQGTGPPIMVGGFSKPALRRAATRGLGIFLPFSMDLNALRETIDRYREACVQAGHVPGRIGMLKYAWPTDGSRRALDEAREMFATSAREYSGAWFPMQGVIGFEDPQRLEAQLRRGSVNALIGTPDEIAAGIEDLRRVGVDLVVLQLAHEDVEVDYRRALQRLGAEVLPQLTALANGPARAAAAVLR